MNQSNNTYSDQDNQFTEILNILAEAEEDVVNGRTGDIKETFEQIHIELLNQNRH